MAGTTASGHHADEDHEDAHDDGHEHTSRWPLIAAVGAAGLYLGAGLYFVGQDLVPSLIPVALVVLGVGGLLTGLAGWVYEAFVSDFISRQPGERSDLYRTTMLLFLVSDVATFSAGFVYYAFIRAGTWPPAELPHLLSSLVLVNTALLIASSVTLHYGHHALNRGDRKRFLTLLGVTLLLGVVFVAGQVLEYVEFITGEGFTLASGVFASAFYGLTGLHGLHVSLGVVLLGIAFGRALRGTYSESHDTGIETASLYWHFVDVVWVFLVAVLYVGAVIGT